MLRDNRVGSLHQCLENPRTAGAELSLTEDVTSPFQAEPRHLHTPLIEPDVRICRIRLSEKTHAMAIAIACDVVCDF